MKPVQFILGTMLEITDEERDVLHNLSAVMKREAGIGRVGWFREYLEAHRHATAIVIGIFKRSHASGAPGHGSGH